MDFFAMLLDDDDDDDNMLVDEGSDFELEFAPECEFEVSESPLVEVDEIMDTTESLDPEDEESNSEISTASSETSSAVHHIEDMVLSFLTQLSSAREEGYDTDERSKLDDRVSTKKRSVHGYKIQIQLADRTKEETESGPAKKCLQYPKKVKTGSAKPFAQLFKVLDLAHEASLNSIPTTKRDIYYKDVGLFKSQKVVDALVDDLAATFHLARSDLNIRSSSKGLICGSGLMITLLSGEIIQCNDYEGSLIPAGEDIEAFNVDENVSWILIVEKEAVFQTMCKLGVCRHDNMPGPGILITGKGYPDLATRHIVKSFADALPKSVPILGLMDADPFGLDILSVYKYGSRSMQHENIKLAAKRIKWLGVWASELESFGVDRDALLPITKYDENKAFAMLQQERIPISKRWRKELQHMIHSRRKAEIEILSGNRGPGKEGKSSQKDFNEKHLLFAYLSSKIAEFVRSNVGK